MLLPKMIHAKNKLETKKFGYLKSIIQKVNTDKKFNSEY